MPVVTEKVTRRAFVGTGAMALGAAAVGRPVWAAAGRTERRRHAFDHVVVVMMENRSFDHFLGWVPGADGRQAGLTYTDAAGVAHPTHPLAPDFQGCAQRRPRPLLRGRPRRVQRRRVRRLAARGPQRRLCDRLLPAEGPRASSARPSRAGRRSTRYFAAIMAETFPNRIYQHAGADRPPAQHARPSRRSRRSGTAWPTPGSRAATTSATCRSWRSGARSTCRSAATSRSSSPTAPPARCRTSRSSTRASLGEDAGHLERRPPARRHPQRRGVHGPHLPGRDARARPGRAPCCVINYDEWGGFFDHVPPPAGADPAADRPPATPDGLRGFRVPCLLVSPLRAARARRHGVVRPHVDPEDDRVALGAAAADRPRPRAHDLGQELTGPRRLDAPQFHVPEGPFGGACPAVPEPGAPSAPAPPVARAAAARRSERSEWLDLLEVAASHGWPV